MGLTRRVALAQLSAGALLPACAAAETALQPTPAQTEGPFYPVGAAVERDADLTRLAGRAQRAAGPIIEVRGRVLDARGAPVSGARLELWQANAAGRYNHPFDSGPAPLDSNFQGYAVLESGADGRSGRYVRIQHDDGTLTSYMHMDAIAPDLQPGNRVVGGQYVGTLGATAVGNTPPHCHFSLELPNKTGDKGDVRDTHYIDPAPFLVRSTIVKTPLRQHSVKPAF